MSNSTVKSHTNHNHSLVLTDDENLSIFSLLSRGQTSLATAVIQLLLSSVPDHREWELFSTGVMCFIKDNQNRSYYFNLFDFDTKTMIWEQEIYLNINYIQVEPLFHMFEAENCMSGLNFIDEREAEHFANVVQQKANFILRMFGLKRKMGSNRPRDDSNLNTNNTLNVPDMKWLKTRSLDSLKSERKSSKLFEKGFRLTKSKQKVNKLDIGHPTDFRHIQHIGWSPSTGFDFNVIDPKLQNFFEMAGVSADQLEDIDTRKFIMNFIDAHGGIGAAIQSASQSIQINQSENVNPAGKKGYPQSDKAVDNNTTKVDCSPTLPPPPPPPPTIFLCENKISDDTKDDPNTTNSMSNSNNSCQITDTRNVFLEQIRSGISLKSTAGVKNASQSTLPLNNKSSNTLADALSQALQNRFRVNQTVNSLSDDSDDNDLDDEEWDD